MAKGQMKSNKEARKPKKEKPKTIAANPSTKGSGGARQDQPLVPVTIWVDADACPVKDEVYKVAWRTGAGVKVVSNSPIRVPDHPQVERIVVPGNFDAADDWIAQRADARSIVVTADILLADRCLKAGASVIAPTGKPFINASIGGAIATRAILADLRAGGDQLGGPAPFAKADRSRFLQALDAAIVRLSRAP